MENPDSRDKSRLVNLFRTILVLGRTSNLPTVWTNVLAAWFLAGGKWETGLAWAVAAGSLLYVGGMTLNDAFDAAWDQKFGKDRPISQGQITLSEVWILGSTWLVSGAILMIFVANAAWWWVLALVAAILLYNWIHKRWERSMWIMGLCRTLLFITAASILTPMPDPQVWFWGIALLLYVSGITMAAQGENTGGSVKHFSICLLILPAVLGIAMVFAFKTLDSTTLRVGIVFLFVAWIALGYRQLKTGVGPFIGWLLAGMVLIDAMAVSSASLLASSICAALLPLNRFLQRFVPAT